MKFFLLIGQSNAFEEFVAPNGPHLLKIQIGGPKIAIRMEKAVKNINVTVNKRANVT